MTTELEQLAARFRIPGVSIESTEGGLAKVVVESELCTGELYLHGAQITGFRPRGHEPVLWNSQHSYFESGKPIRGGVPICFPWFGPNANDPGAPSHGLARTVVWNLEAVDQANDGSIGLRLTQQVDGFQLGFEASFGDMLTMRLTALLPPQGTSPKSFEAALHTYFNVGSIHRVSIAGLESAEYLDKVQAGKRVAASGDEIRFDSECDRVYLDTTADCILKDAELGREIRIAKRNSNNTIVWNPWVSKSARMPDFGDSEWTQMVCIETANVGDAAVTLQPGAAHTMSVEISV